MRAGRPATGFSRSWSCRLRRDTPSRAGSSRPAARSAPTPAQRKTRRPPARGPAAANSQHQVSPRRLLGVLGVVADAVDRAVVLIRDQQRAVLHLEQIGGPAI